MLVEVAALAGVGPVQHCSNGANERRGAIPWLNGHDDPTLGE